MATLSPTPFNGIQAIVYVFKLENIYHLSWCCVMTGEYANHKIKKKNSIDIECFICCKNFLKIKSSWW